MQSIRNTQPVLYLINSILTQLFHPLFMQKYNHFLWFSDNIHVCTYFLKANSFLFSKLVLNHVTHRVVAQGQLNMPPSNLVITFSDPKHWIKSVIFTIITHTVFRIQYRYIYSNACTLLHVLKNKVSYRYIDSKTMKVTSLGWYACVNAWTIIQSSAFTDN